MTAENLEILASSEAEQSVIGAILIDNTAADMLSDLSAEAFFFLPNRLIFQTAMQMAADGLPVDVVTLDAELEKRGLNEQTGGMAYLIGLCQNTPSAANVRRYAKLVSDFSTGLNGLDEATGGLQRGNLTVIGARPGMGKSVLAENIARHFAKSGLSVRFQSYEMSAVELVQRGAAAEYGIDYGRLKKFRMTQMERDNFTLYLSKSQNWKFAIDTEMAGIDTLAARCRVEKRKSGLDVLFVDHLHLMPRKGVNEVAELDDITARLKRLAMELQITHDNQVALDRIAAQFAHHLVNKRITYLKTVWNKSFNRHFQPLSQPRPTVPKPHAPW